MSHEREAIARAFGRPFTEPPKRAPAKRIGFTLAGIALVAAALIANERQSDATSATNGLECTTTTVSETADSKETSAPGTFLIEFLPDNRARFSIIWTPGQDTEPMTTTDREYTIGKRVDTARSYDSGTTINRVTGHLSTFVIWDRDRVWHRNMVTGTCHAVHISAKM
jgi:hypothetical protein